VSSVLANTVRLDPSLLQPEVKKYTANAKIGQISGDEGLA